jgi:hypothetical protein
MFRKDLDTERSSAVTPRVKLLVTSFLKINIHIQLILSKHGVTFLENTMFRKTASDTTMLYELKMYGKIGFRTPKEEFTHVFKAIYLV